MRLPQLLVYFDTSPALRLLKSANAPFIIDFLDRQFKHTGRIAISHSELLSALVDYRERTQEAYPDRLPSRADTYLAEWCSPDVLWLRRFLEAGRDEPMYQLTPHTEDVFVYVPYSGQGSCPRVRRQMLAEARAVRRASSRFSRACMSRRSSSGERNLTTPLLSTGADLILPIGLADTRPHSVARDRAARSARMS